MKPAIVVLGSLNMDFVVRTAHLPAPGETVLGGGFQMIPGGKGANQACAAGRLASNALVRMIGRVGYDVFADHLEGESRGRGRGCQRRRCRAKRSHWCSADRCGRRPDKTRSLSPRELMAYFRPPT